jgi:hypothetical protein
VVLVDHGDLSRLNSRELVLEAMKGKASRIPLYFWLADAELEARLGDIVGVRCWFKSLEFLERGGPFRKGNESRGEWRDRIQPESYDWPTIDELVSEMDQIVRETARVDRTKSFQLELLGPTEYSEYSCSPSRSSQSRRLDQVSHQFDFSVLTVLDARKANEIHKRFFDLLVQAASRATEFEAIDSVRIADDFCDYTGSIYRPDFTETIVERQTELGQIIKARGKYSVLHADGDIRKHLPRLVRAYSGVHPLDVVSKSTVTDAHRWADELANLRQMLQETVFFTGIPVDLLCNSSISAEEVVDVAEHVIRFVGPSRLVLTTTHRPYPGVSFEDFKEKVDAIRRLVRSAGRQVS